MNGTRNRCVSIRLSGLPINTIRARGRAVLGEGRQRSRRYRRIRIRNVINSRSLGTTRVKVALGQHERYQDRFIGTRDLRRAGYVRRVDRGLGTNRVRQFSGVLLRGQRSLIGFNRILKVDDLRERDNWLFFGIASFRKFLRVWSVSGWVLGGEVLFFIVCWGFLLALISHWGQSGLVLVGRSQGGREVRFFSVIRVDLLGRFFGTYFIHGEGT